MGFDLKAASLIPQVKHMSAQFRPVFLPSIATALSTGVGPQCSLNIARKTGRGTPGEC